MMRSIEIEYDGGLDEELLDNLVGQLGLLVESIRPLVVRTGNPRRDVPAVIGFSRFIPGVRHIWIRSASDSVALAAGAR